MEAAGWRVCLAKHQQIMTIGNTERIVYRLRVVFFKIHRERMKGD